MWGSPVGVTLKGLTLWLPSWCEGLERLPSLNIWASRTPSAPKILPNTSHTLAHTHTHTHTQHPHMSMSLTPTHTSRPKQTKPYREIRPASTWLTLICSVNTQHYEPIETGCLAAAAWHRGAHLAPKKRVLKLRNNSWLASLLELWGALIHIFIWVRHNLAGWLPTG